MMVEESCDHRYCEMSLGDTGAGATAAAAPMGDKTIGGEVTLDGVLAWSECSSSEEAAERDGPAQSCAGRSDPPAGTPTPEGSSKTANCGSNLLGAMEATNSSSIGSSVASRTGSTS